VAEKVRKMTNSTRTFFIVAYQQTGQPGARPALKCGMDHFVSKPEWLPCWRRCSVVQPGLATGSVAGRLAAPHPGGRRQRLRRKAIALPAQCRGHRHRGGTWRRRAEQLHAQDGIHAVIVDPTASMDGRTRQVIRAAHGLGGVPILTMTASRVCAVARHGAGMNGFLVKPVDAMLSRRSPPDRRRHRAARGGEGSSRSQRRARPPPREQLLNLQRLESYRRLGMLDELLNDYLPEMDRLVLTLQQAVDGGDVQGSIDALHSLLGMSGEAGAQALYQNVRKLYVPLLEQGQWPSGDQWLPQLHALAHRTEEALRAYCAEQTRSGTPS
jgi:HPt (histidine-containing phosphotransfer) domain-containing protein